METIRAGSLAALRGRLFSRGGGHWAAMRESERGSPMTVPRATEDLPSRVRLPLASDWRARCKGSSSEGCPAWRAGAPELRCPFPCSFAAGFLGAKRSGSDCLAERAELAAAPGKGPREAAAGRRLCGPGSVSPGSRSQAGEAAPWREQWSRPEQPGKESALNFGSKRASEGPLKQP